MRDSTLAKGFDLIHIIYMNRKLYTWTKWLIFARDTLKEGCHNAQSLLVLFKHNMKSKMTLLTINVPGHNSSVPVTLKKCFHNVTVLCVQSDNEYIC